MKFVAGITYKHKKCSDAFLSLDKVIEDTGETAKIVARWCIQGNSTWWPCDLPLVELSINKDNYDQWFPYMPHEDRL